MDFASPALDDLPDPGKPIFYPKVGHCIFKGVIEDKVAPGTKLLELEDLEEESRILIPIARVPSLNLRAAGVAFEDIKAVLSSPFEEPLEEDEEREKLLAILVEQGTPDSLGKALKHLHLMRQTDGLTREEELTRKKVRSWLAAEVALARESTRAEAQAFMTRILQDAMAAHKQKEKDEAKERRRAAKAAKDAETAEAEARVIAAEAAETADAEVQTTDPAKDADIVASVAGEAEVVPRSEEPNRSEPSTESKSADADNSLAGASALIGLDPTAEGFAGTGPDDKT